MVFIFETNVSSLLFKHIYSKILEIFGHRFARFQQDQNWNGITNDNVVNTQH